VVALLSVKSKPSINPLIELLALVNAIPLSENDASSAFWLSVILFWSDPYFLLLLGQNANNLLLIPLAYGILHLAMREAPGRRMGLVLELGLLLTIWAIVSFTAINLYHSWSN